ncbi:hypothetical protein CC2G_005157 [Coprinopsis cinerea AmutBmut pab1-1]|nr:hypothetical protein CC2G_005157 [Coprinopsis cinerea AmutBmut pab1-1]
MAQAARPWTSEDPLQFPIPNEEKTLKDCRKLVEKLDTVKCEAWKDEIQNLLLFAGLFSAIVTGFSVEATKSLQDSPDDISIQLLARITSQLDESLNATGSIRPIPRIPSFAQPANATRVNILWSVSLTLSLGVATISILCLQWLREYQRQDPSRPDEDALASRYVREESLKMWRVPLIISILPIILLTGLALFLIGLVDYFHAMSPLAGWILSGFVGLTLLILVVTTVLPAVYDFWIISSTGFRVNPAHCAYRSPQAWAVSILCSAFVAALSSIDKVLGRMAVWKYMKAFINFLWFILWSDMQAFYYVATWPFKAPVRAIAWLFSTEPRPEGRRDAYSVGKVRSLPNWLAYDAWWRNQLRVDYITAICSLAREHQGTDNLILFAAYYCIRDMASMSGLERATWGLLGGAHSLNTERVFSQKLHVAKDWVMFAVGSELFSGKYSMRSIGEWECRHLLELFVRLTPVLVEEYTQQSIFPTIFQNPALLMWKDPPLPSDLRIRLFACFEKFLSVRPSQEDPGNRDTTGSAAAPTTESVASKLLLDSTLALITTFLLDPIPEIYDTRAQISEIVRAGFTALSQQQGFGDFYLYCLHPWEQARYIPDPSATVDTALMLDPHMLDVVVEMEEFWKFLHRYVKGQQGRKWSRKERRDWASFLSRVRIESVPRSSWVDFSDVLESETLSKGFELTMVRPVLRAIGLLVLGSDGSDTDPLTDSPDVQVPTRVDAGFHVLIRFYRYRRSEVGARHLMYNFHKHCLYSWTLPSNEAAVINSRDFLRLSESFKTFVNITLRARWMRTSWDYEQRLKRLYTLLDLPPPIQLFSTHRRGRSRNSRVSSTTRRRRSISNRRSTLSSIGLEAFPTREASSSMGEVIRSEPISSFPPTTQHSRHSATNRSSSQQEAPLEPLTFPRFRDAQRDAWSVSGDDDPLPGEPARTHLSLSISSVPSSLRTWASERVQYPGPNRRRGREPYNPWGIGWRTYNLSRSGSSAPSIGDDDRPAGRGRVRRSRSHSPRPWLGQYYSDRYAASPIVPPLGSPTRHSVPSFRRTGLPASAASSSSLVAAEKQSEGNFSTATLIAIGSERK